VRVLALVACVLRFTASGAVRKLLNRSTLDLRLRYGLFWCEACKIRMYKLSSGALRHHAGQYAWTCRECEYQRRSADA